MNGPCIADGSPFEAHSLRSFAPQDDEFGAASRHHYRARFFLPDHRQLSAPQK